MRRHIGQTSQAFTLVELLVGLMVLTLILGAAAMVFVTSMDSWENGNEARRTLHAARTTAELIERHLRSAIPPGGEADTMFRGEDLSDGDNEGHRLTLVSAAAVRFPRSAPLSDRSEITFEFDPLGDGELTMRIDSSPDDVLDAGGYLIPTSPLVRAFSVSYFDGEEWLEQWLTDDAPRAVQFTLLLGEAEIDEAGSTAEDREPRYEYSRLVALPRHSPEEEEAGLEENAEQPQPGGGSETPGVLTGGAP